MFTSGWCKSTNVPSAYMSGTRYECIVRIVRPTLQGTKYNECVLVLLHLIQTEETKDYVTWADVLILVFSLSDASSFHKLRDLTHTLQLKYKRLPSLVLVGNKRDLTHIREISASQAQSLAGKLGCPYVETSASADRESGEKIFQTVYQELDFEPENAKGSHCMHNVKKNGFAMKKKAVGLMSFKEHLRNLTDFRSRTNTF